jgi:hypothetical protein
MARKYARKRRARISYVQRDPTRFLIVPEETLRKILQTPRGISHFHSSSARSVVLCAKFFGRFASDSGLLLHARRSGGRSPTSRWSLPDSNSMIGELGGYFRERRGDSFRFLVQHP